MAKEKCALLTRSENLEKGSFKAENHNIQKVLLEFVLVPTLKQKKRRRKDQKIRAYLSVEGCIWSSEKK